MAKEYEPVIDIGEETEIGWRNYLREFEEDLWPFFEERGYSKDTALIVWTMNRTRVEIAWLREEMTDNDDDWSDQ